MKEILYVAAGGATGAVLRYLTGLAIPRSAAESFPFATLLVNLVGSFALGLLAAFGARETVSGELRLLLGVGVLGALTTFSTFSVETVFLFRAGRPAAAAGNLLANVGLCVAAVAIATWLVQRGR